MQLSILLLRFFPEQWTVAELAIATGGNRRSIERALGEMTEAGLTEKNYHSYRIHFDLGRQILAAANSIKKNTEKTLWLERQKKQSPQKKS